MMETVWFYVLLLEQREFILVIIVHDCVSFVFFFLALFLCFDPIFLVYVSSFRFFYCAEQTNPLIPCLFTLIIFFFFCGPSARCRAMVSPLSVLRYSYVFTRWGCQPYASTPNPEGF